MKLIRAEFQNFRLLRDLSLEFSTDPHRNLTIIRAANESGKTTILHGLQWALYGDVALPGKGVGFRLHPIDWNANDGKQVQITATVEFEVTKHRHVGKKLIESRRRYRLVRTSTEGVDDQERRLPSTVKLFGLKDTGYYSIESPESIINDELPPELREVFFTDGDRALSFIETDVSESTKRERVHSAIRSLLGLGVIKNAIQHVNRSRAEVNTKAKHVATSGELNKISSTLVEIEENLQKYEEDFADAKQQFETFDNEVNITEKKIETALQKGDKEKLRKDLTRTKNEKNHFENQLDLATKTLSELFRSQLIAYDLLKPVLDLAFEKLLELHDQGKIPSTTVPILKDRLVARVCICGETLDIGNKEGEIRRKHIQKLIEDSEQADELQKIITELYYSTAPILTEGHSSSKSWLKEYTKVVQQRDEFQTLREISGRKLRELERQLDDLPNTNIQGLRQTLRDYKDLRDRFLSKQSKLETQLISLKEKREEQEKVRNRLLFEQNKGTRILAELDVINDVKHVLSSSLEQITNNELQKVSNLMNGIFLEMIGADPEQGAIIQKAEISKDFDIIVYGPNNRMLNPDRDLNGASRRALTLSFIQSLTKISEVEAPNVIDTPLGMTSGFVKRSILRTAARESSQLILFLTHDEIAGCEEIIDQIVGKIITLTNPAHYPTMLVNNPGIEDRKVLRCECNHRKECQLCQRHADLQVELI